MNQRGFNVVDVVLIIVILGSMGSILFLIFNPKITPSVTTPSNIAVQAGPRTRTADVPVKLPAPPNVSDAAWSKLLADPAFNSARVSRTDGCVETFGEIDWGFHTPNTERIKQVQQKQPVTVLNLPEFPCYEVGQTVNIVTFSDSPDEPVVKYIGTMRVADLVSIKLSQIPDLFYSFTGFTREQTMNDLRAKRRIDSSSIDNIIRFSSADLQMPDPAVVPRVLRMGRVINAKHIDKLKAQTPNAVLVDVREATEYARGSLPGAINIPFTLPAGKSSAFNWKVTNKEIAQARFNLAELVRIGDSTPIVLFAADAKDGRAFWAAHIATAQLRRSYRLLHQGFEGRQR